MLGQSCTAPSARLQRPRPALHHPGSYVPSRRPLPPLRHCVVRAGPQRRETPKGPLRQARAPRPPEPPLDGASWRFFDLGLYTQPWADVPWGTGTVVLGLGGGAVLFVATGLLVAPLLAASAGVSLRELAAPQRVEYLLALQAAETAQGLAVVYLATRRFCPLPPDLFVFDLSQPLQAPNGWLVWSLLGYGTAFAAIAVAAGAAGLLSGGVPETGAGTVDGVLPLLGGGVGGYLGLLGVTAVLAPVLEETLFRGFLLPWLTTWLPGPAALLLSATLFAAAHFAPRDFPQLLALGLVLGAAYGRTRNLAVPMAIHGLWNGGTLTVLTALIASGAKVEL